MIFRNLSYSQFIVIFFLCISGQPLLAQWEIGAKTGINLGKQEFHFNGDFLSTSQYIIGLDLGIVVRRQLGKALTLGTELNFVEKGEKFDEVYELQLKEVELSLYLNVGYEIKKTCFYLNTGGFLGYIYDGKASLRGSKYNYRFSDEYTNRIDIGLLFSGGLGYTLGSRHKLIVESRYRYSLNYFVDNKPQGDFGPYISKRNKGIGFSLMYLYEFGGK